MSVFFEEIRDTFVPSREGKFGPLPPLLVTMTLVTGLVDSFSYLVLGHVFVANMTGNIVILGFALVGAPGFSIAASVVAIASFMVGSTVGGRIASRVGGHRGKHLLTATLFQVALLTAGVVLAAFVDNPLPAGRLYALIAVLAVAMGIQNATARKLAVPDLTTTVLTLTITGLAADSTIAGGTGSKAGRRLVAVAAMLIGAVVGAAFVVHDQIVYPLLIAAVVTVAVATAAGLSGRSNPTWAVLEG